MSANYRYRLLKDAAWGIAIDLRAESSPLPVGPLALGSAKVAEGLWLQTEGGRPFTEEESTFLITGLRLVAAEIAKRQAEPILVRIIGVEYNPCDYQPEGLAAAVAEWAAREFGFSAPEIPVAFDRDQNRYVFMFDQATPRPDHSALALG